MIKGKTVRDYRRVGGAFYPIIATEDDRKIYVFRNRTYGVPDEYIEEKIVRAENRAFILTAIYLSAMWLLIDFMSVHYPSKILYMLAFILLLWSMPRIFRLAMFPIVRMLKGVNIDLRPMTWGERFNTIPTNHNPGYFFISFFCLLIPNHLYFRPIAMDMIRPYLPRPEPVVENMIVYYPFSPDGPGGRIPKPPEPPTYLEIEADFVWAGTCLGIYVMCLFLAWFYYRAVREQGRFF